MNSYKWDGHTADARLLLRGKTEQDLLEQGLHGVYAFMKPVATERMAPIVNLNLQSKDMTHLLVDFLSNVVTWSAVHKAYYHTLRIHKINHNHLEAILEGHLVERFGKDIKAATHHEAAVHHVEGYFEGVVIFDI